MFRKLTSLEAGGAFCPVVRKPAPTADGELGRVSPCHPALLSDAGQARGRQKRASHPCFRIPPLCKLPRGDLPGRTPGQGSPGFQHNSWNSRFSGHTHGRVPSVCSPETWATHADLAGMWRVLAAVASLSHSCFFLCPAGLVFLLCLGDSSKYPWSPLLVVVSWGI